MKWQSQTARVLSTGPDIGITLPFTTAGAAFSFTLLTQLYWPAVAAFLFSYCRSLLSR